MDWLLSADRKSAVNVTFPFYSATSGQVDRTDRLGKWEFEYTTHLGAHTHTPSGITTSLGQGGSKLGKSEALDGNMCM